MLAADAAVQSGMTKASVSVAVALVVVLVSVPLLGAVSDLTRRETIIGAASLASFLLLALPSLAGAGIVALNGSDWEVAALYSAVNATAAMGRAAGALPLCFLPGLAPSHSALVANMTVSILSTTAVLSYRRVTEWPTVDELAALPRCGAIASCSAAGRRRRDRSGSVTSSSSASSSPRHAGVTGFDRLSALAIWSVALPGPSIDATAAVVASTVINGYMAAVSAILVLDTAGPGPADLAAAAGPADGPPPLPLGPALAASGYFSRPAGGNRILRAALVALSAAIIAAFAARLLVLWASPSLRQVHWRAASWALPSAAAALVVAYLATELARSWGPAVLSAGHFTRLAVVQMTAMIIPVAAVLISRTAATANAEASAGRARSTEESLRSFILWSNHELRTLLTPVALAASELVDTAMAAPSPASEDATAAATPPLPSVALVISGGVARATSLLTSSLDLFRAITTGRATDPACAWAPVASSMRKTVGAAFGSPTTPVHAAAGSGLAAAAAAAADSLAAAASVAAASVESAAAVTITTARDVVTAADSTDRAAWPRDDDTQITATATPLALADAASFPASSDSAGRPSATPGSVGGIRLSTSAAADADGAAHPGAPRNRPTLAVPRNRRSWASASPEPGDATSATSPGPPSSKSRTPAPWRPARAAAVMPSPRDDDDAAIDAAADVSASAAADAASRLTPSPLEAALARAAPAEVRVIVDPSAESVDVFTSVDTVTLATANFVTNALKFAPHGSRVDVRVRCAPASLLPRLIPGRGEDGSQDQVERDGGSAPPIAGNGNSNSNSKVGSSAPRRVPDSVLVEQDRANAAVLVVEVEDAGPGIAASHQNRLFESFADVGTKAVGVASTGIGLALVRESVERLGGTVGYRHAFDPPAEQAEPDGAELAEEDPAAAPGRPRRGLGLAAARSPGSVFWFAVPVATRRQTRQSRQDAARRRLSRPASIRALTQAAERRAGAAAAAAGPGAEAKRSANDPLWRSASEPSPVPAGGLHGSAEPEPTQRQARAARRAARRTGRGSPPRSGRAAEPKASPSSPSEPPPTVLVVDDSAAIRSAVARVVQRMGLAPRPACSGEEALAALRELCTAEPAGEGPPRIAVLLDRDMPGGMGGMEVLEALQQCRAGGRSPVSAAMAKVPVVMATGAADPETEARARRLGAVAVLAKPLTRDAIAECLRAQGLLG